MNTRMPGKIVATLLATGLLWLAQPPLTQAQTDQAQTVWLDTLPLKGMTQGWGAPQRNRSIREQPLAIAGKSFERGVGTHAVSRYVLNLQGGAERFSAWVGVDDAAGNKGASIEFIIKGDKKVLWQSGTMRLGDAAKEINLELRGIKRLELLVNDAGDGVSYDHANWANAKLVTSGQVPQELTTARVAPYILTPKPPRAPRINGAKIFGVRPGHPFLFTIPATGERPMTFAVDDLPEGLKVDAETGQITGSLPVKGEHVVTFKASNVLGTAARKFKIVCGDTLALTPHMGWNSWYVWENHVTDEIMRAAADGMVSSGMMNHGYMYVNIDDCWSVKPKSNDPTLGGEPRDAQGKINSNQRFPDMKALTDYIHSKGLKAGTYTSPGPLTCAGHVGAYEHEALDAQRYAEWGFDFLKHDWCSYGGVVKEQNLENFKKPYIQMGDLLRQQNRDIILNLCQYGMGRVWEWGKQVGGHSWRTAGDLGGSFEGIASALFRDGFDVYSQFQLHQFGGPGGWNDPDYLLLGYLSNWKGQTVPTPLTPDEQYTHVSLWCLVAAPLIFSGDITRLDEFTLSLLTNDEVIEVDQDPLGKPGRRMLKDGDLEVWMKEMEDGTKAVGLFNRDSFDAQSVTARWSDLGLTGKQAVRDLWRQKELGTFEGQFQATVPAHGVVLLRLRAVKD